MPYNINVIRIGIGLIVRGIGRRTNRERQNKTHSISYNSKKYKNSGGEELEVFDFDNTVSNPSDTFSRVI